MTDLFSSPPFSPHFDEPLDGEFQRVHGLSAAALLAGTMFTMINDGRLALGKAPIGFTRPAVGSFGITISILSRSTFLALLAVSPGATIWVAIRWVTTMVPCQWARDTPFPRSPQLVAVAAIGVILDPLSFKLNVLAENATVPAVVHYLECLGVLGTRSEN